MLHLRRRDADPISILSDSLAPDRLAKLSAHDIAALPVRRGNRPAMLGDCFEITGDPADGELRLAGDCGNIAHLGAGMTHGRIVIEGSTGPHLGARMSGGTIEVHGDADDWAGAEMRGGHIRIHGSAGSRVGAAYPGSTRGMRGGVILVDGNAGDGLGASMRRGLIAIGGECGDFAASGAIAGTVMLFGTVGRHVAAGLKRGTVMTFGQPPAVLPTFHFNCADRPVVLDLYLRQLRTWNWLRTDAVMAGPVSRFHGDFAVHGQGEVWVWGSA